MTQSKLPLYNLSLDALQVGWLLSSIEKMESQPGMFDRLLLKSIKDKLYKVADADGYVLFPAPGELPTE